MFHGILAFIVLPLAAMAQTTSPAQPMATEAFTAQMPKEVVVLGRMPGPPLWKISNGEKVMWIFPHIGVVPKDMVWESGRVENLIAEAQEYLPMPSAGRGITTSLNPVNLVRLRRLYNRSVHLPAGQTFAEVLPPALYQRFSALKARYFPGNDKIERFVPRHAYGAMRDAIFDHETLGSAFQVTKQINAFVKRNKAIRITSTSHMMFDKVKFKELKEIVERDDAAFSAELQVMCMEKRLAYFENEVPLLRTRAYAWAQGYVDDVLLMTNLREDLDPCSSPAVLEENLEMEAMRQNQWLAAAEAALVTNHRTFAVLGIEDILAQDGLVAGLQAKGYRVEIASQ